MVRATSLIADILLATLRGEGLRTVIEDRILRQESELVGHPFSRWQNEQSPSCSGLSRWCGWTS